MPRAGAGPRLVPFAKRGGTFYIVWSEKGRSRERSTGTRDRREAEIALAQFLLSRPGIGPVEPDRYLITDALAEYALDRADQVMDRIRLAGAVLKLTDFFEGRRVSEVSPSSCRAYVKWRNRAAGTARRELTVLRAAINHAHGTGRLTRMVPVELPAPPPSRTRWLKREEAARLLKAACASPKSRLHLPLFILIGLYSGQRKEAILSLRWSQIDLRTGLMDFRMPGRKETKKKRSYTQIPPRLLCHLRNARKRGSADGPVIHIAGKPVADIKTAFRAACRRAGLNGVTPHTLRHTSATWLMQAGVPKWEAAGFLAMSLETLEKTYGHHHPDHHALAAISFSRKDGGNAPRNAA